MRMRRLKAVKEEMDLSQSSYRLKRTISGWVALRIRSPKRSIFRHAWNGN